MRKSRVIMATAERQFEYENKKHLRQDALMRRRFLLNGFFGDGAFVTGIEHPSPQHRLGPIAPVDMAKHP